MDKHAVLQHNSYEAATAFQPSPGYSTSESAALQAMHQHCTIAMELLSALVLGAGQGLMCVLAMAAGGRGGHHLLKLARAVL